MYYQIGEVTRILKRYFWGGKYIAVFSKRFFEKLLENKVSRKRIKPKTLQLPITYKCNFDCVMCGMRNLSKNTDFTVEDLKKIMKDPLFENIESIGINGGEPFLRKDLVECVKVLLELPKLRVIYFISNGYFTEKILKKLIDIKRMCSIKNVKSVVSFSVDGADDMQDLMRGHIDAFTYVDRTCRLLLEHKEKYCDQIDIISTITKINIARIYEVEEWAKKIGLNVSYNIATIHERICNDYKYKDFSIFADEESRHLAMEFFYGKFRETKSERYFALYYYIKTGKRIAYCDYQYNAVTLIPNGNISYCATHSKELGNAMELAASEIYYENLDYQKELTKQYCLTCSHYIYALNLEGLKLYYKELMRLI